MHKRSAIYGVLSLVGIAVFSFGIKLENDFMNWVGFLVGTISGLAFTKEAGFFIGEESIKKPNRHEKRAITDLIIGLGVSLVGVGWFIYRFYYGGVQVPGSYYLYSDKLIAPVLVVFLGVAILVTARIMAMTGGASRIWKNSREAKFNTRLIIYAGFGLLTYLIYWLVNPSTK